MSVGLLRDYKLSSILVLLNFCLCTVFDFGGPRYLDYFYLYGVL